MTMISYAQNAEDVLLRRALGDRAGGYYIDVGANDPTWCSVTRHFYDAGWDGINIEPGRIFDKLATARARDVNLNCGLSNRPGHFCLYEFPDKPGLSTCHADVAEAHRREHRSPYVERLVNVETLAAVCQRYVTRAIDFLKIDVEGHELEVIEGGDWQRWRPRVVVVEAPTLHTETPNHLTWEHLLLGADYRYATCDGLNRYYVRAEDEPLVKVLGVPANVMDDFVPYHHIHAYQGLGPVALRVARLVQRLQDVVRPPRKRAA